MTAGAWEKVRSQWACPLKSQLGWDFSVSYVIWKNGWKLIAPRVGRATNIGRCGRHATPGWFVQNIAGSVCSDGRSTGYFYVVPNTAAETPSWIVDELNCKEARKWTTIF